MIVTQVLRFYKRQLKELTERLSQERVGHGEIQVTDQSLDDRLDALRSLAGEHTFPTSKVLCRVTFCLVCLKLYKDCCLQAAGLDEHFTPAQPHEACLSLRMAQHYNLAT